VAAGTGATTASGATLNKTITTGGTGAGVNVNITGGAGTTASKAVGTTATTTSGTSAGKPGSGSIGIKVPLGVDANVNVGGAVGSIGSLTNSVTSAVGNTVSGGVTVDAKVGGSAGASTKPRMLAAVDNSTQSPQEANGVIRVYINGYESQVIKLNFPQIAYVKSGEDFQWLAFCMNGKQGPTSLRPINVVRQGSHLDAPLATLCANY